MKSRPNYEPDLSDRNLLFCDHLVALEHAKKCGFPASGEVRTSSPHLLLSKMGYTEAESVKDATQRKNLGSVNAKLGRALWYAFNDLDELSYLKVVVAQSVIRFERALYRATLMDEKDYDRKLALTRVNIDKNETSVILNVGDEQDYLFNGPWKSLLASHPDLIPVQVPLQEIPPKQHTVNTPMSFWDRYRATGFPRLGYRIATEIWSRLPSKLAKGTAFILRENPLLRETAFHLSYRGIALKKLRPIPFAEEYEVPWIMKIDEFIRPIVEFWIKPLVTSWILDSTVDLFIGEVIKNIRHHEFQRLNWQHHIPPKEYDRNTFVLSNMLVRPESSALLCVAHERKIPFITFQHGVSREITPMEQHELLMEPVSSDLCFGYNQTFKNINHTISLPHGKTKIVGTPTDYLNVRNLRANKKNTPPILYASTALYTGYIQAPSRHRDSDVAKARQEIKLIDDVFGVLPHKILYKGYPEPRFLDEDPVLKEARSFLNITVYDGPLDLRHMIRNCRIIVTSRATSTVSWCILSGKPVIFIDLPKQLPLTNAARKAFKESLFLFDGSGINFHDELRVFLSHDITFIEREYEKLATRRKKMISTFMTSQEQGAGELAAKFLIKNSISLLH